MIGSYIKDRMAAFTGSAALVCLSGLPLAHADPAASNKDAQFRPDAKQNIVLVQKGSDPHGTNPPYDSDDHSRYTRSPIKHVILIIGENRTFDHVFATYTPPKGQTVSNLLSKGIVNKDGTPGPKVALARQWQATDTGTYSNSPTKTQAYTVLPDINTDGAPTVPFAASAAQAQAVEPALPDGDYFELASGGTNLPPHSIDTRFPSNLPNAPVDMSRSISYNDYASSPVHRFFQMWQQLDCSAKAATRSNPSGCQSDLFPWVEATV